MCKRQLRPEFLLFDVDHDLAGGGSVPASAAASRGISPWPATVI